MQAAAIPPPPPKPPPPWVSLTTCSPPKKKRGSTGDSFLAIPDALTPAQVDALRRRCAELLDA